jgi:hypothetical protein
MHGLGDGPYWIISYSYFLVISVIYMLCFVIFGSVIGMDATSKLFSCFPFLFGIFCFPSLLLFFFFSGLKFFTMNDYSIQFVFYFIYINLQISLAFLLASLFSNVKTATGLMIDKLCYDFLFLLSNLITDFYFCNGSGCIYRCFWHWSISWFSFPIFYSRYIVSK